MPLDVAMRDKLSALVKSKKVVLFMKGNRHFPQCGFSATVIGILDKAGVAGYETVNVLSDPAIRDGIKEFSSWPTIPQLYVDGEFVGGCDIVKEMFATGELHKVLGKDAPEVKAPAISISEAAAKAIHDAVRAASGDGSADVLRLDIDVAFQNDLYFAPKSAGDLEVKTAAGLSIYVDASTASRADGVSIDFVDSAKGAGFKIDNPNEPPRVKSLTVAEAKAMLDAGKLALFDVRPEVERAKATIARATALDDAGRAHLMSLAKDAPVAFHCHHGIRSRHAAEQLLREGFRNVYNVEGGIDAWSQEIDPNVPRY